jgi:predicted lipoprotein
MTKQLTITPKIHQAWIDAEKQMANFDGDDHAAVISHNYIGTAIYGKNLKAAKDHIRFNSNKKNCMIDYVIFK